MKQNNKSQNIEVNNFNLNQNELDKGNYFANRVKFVPNRNEFLTNIQLEKE
jgi:hypothetical protein